MTTTRDTFSIADVADYSGVQKNCTHVGSFNVSTGWALTDQTLRCTPSVANNTPTITGNNHIALEEGVFLVAELVLGANQPCFCVDLHGTIVAQPIVARFIIGTTHTATNAVYLAKANIFTVRTFNNTEEGHDDIVGLNARLGAQLTNPRWPSDSTVDTTERNMKICLYYRNGNIEFWIQVPYNPSYSIGSNNWILAARLPATYTGDIWPVLTGIYNASYTTDSIGVKSVWFGKDDFDPADLSTHRLIDIASGGTLYSSVIHRLPNDNYFFAVHSGNEGTLTGDVKTYRSTDAKHVIWTKAETNVFAADVDYTYVGCSLVASGNNLLIIAPRRKLADSSWDLRARYSDDGGVTWGTEYTIVSGTQYIIERQGIVLSSGQWVLCGHIIGGMKLLSTTTPESADDWVISSIGSGVEGSPIEYNGKLLVAARGNYFPILYTCNSLTDFTTWTSVILDGKGGTGHGPLIDTADDPKHIFSSNGNLYFVTGGPRLPRRQRIDLYKFSHDLSTAQLKDCSPLVINGRQITSLTFWQLGQGAYGCWNSGNMAYAYINPTLLTSDVLAKRNSMFVVH